jgi:hypothetical protein
MSRYVVKPAGQAPSGAQPLDDTGLYVADAPDADALFEQSDGIEWAAPAESADGGEAYPTGEVSIRFAEPIGGEDLDSFISKHGLELLRRNEFVPEQVVTAPTSPKQTWLPDVVDRLNAEGVVAKAWPNTLARYRRG